MALVTFVGQSSRDTSSLASSTSRLVNLYREPVPGGKTEYLLRGVPGMAIFGRTNDVFCRAMFEYDGAIIAVVADRLLRVEAESVDTLATITPSTTAQISRNGDTITVASGGNYYAYTSAGVTTPATGVVDRVRWVEYLAGRTIVGQANSAVFAWSEVGDPATFNGLNFATAESQWDDTLRGLVVANSLMLFGTQSTEVWAPAGAGANAFSLVPGLVRNTGLKAFALACLVEGAVFLVGSDNIAYIASGIEWQAVSTPAVNTAIKDGTPTSCFYWEDRGHKFAVLAFSDRPAWVYDLTTGEWFERGERLDPWRAAHSARLNGDWIVGGTDGNFYSLTDYTRDDGDVLYRSATSAAVYKGGDCFRVASLEFQSAQGFDAATLMLEMGNGVEFGPVRTVQLGGVGGYENRAIFRALGSFRTAVARITLTDPVDIPIYATADARMA